MVECADCTDCPDCTDCTSLMSAVWPELEEIFYKAGLNIRISYYQLLYHIYTSAQTADLIITSVVDNKEEERCRVDLVVGLVGL